MARQSSLLTVRNMVKLEVGTAVNTTTDDSLINQIITNVQNWLASSYDWSFLKLRWTVSVATGTRYINFPTTDDLGTTFSVNFNRPNRLMIKWNNIWMDIVYGISEEEEFNYLDSDRGQVLDPVQRWQFTDEGQFEIWPLPASGQSLRFVGQRMLTPLTSNTSLLDLDDLLVTYFVAGQLLERKKDPLAKDILAKAMRQLSSLRGTDRTRTEVCTIGRGDYPGRRLIKQVPLVLVAGGK